MPLPCVLLAQSTCCAALSSDWLVGVSSHVSDSQRGLCQRQPQTVGEAAREAHAANVHVSYRPTVCCTVCATMVSSAAPAAVFGASSATRQRDACGQQPDCYSAQSGERRHQRPACCRDSFSGGDSWCWDRIHSRSWWSCRCHWKYGGRYSARQPLVQITTQDSVIFTFFCRRD